MLLVEDMLDVGGRQARYSPSSRGLVSVVSDEVLADMLGEAE